MSDEDAADNEKESDEEAVIGRDRKLLPDCGCFEALPSEKWKPMQKGICLTEPDERRDLKRSFEVCEPLARRG